MSKKVSCKHMFKKEREWKKHKLLQMNQIVELEKKLKKLTKAQGSHEQ